MSETFEMDNPDTTQAVQDDAEFDPFEDPEERRVLHAALDSFR